MSTQFSFPPRSSRGSVLGFTWGQIFLVVAGVIVGVFGINVLAAGHPWWAGALFAAALAVMSLGLLRLRGRRITEWLPIVVGALLQRGTRQDRYRGALFAPHAVADHPDFPGPAAGYRWLTALASDGLTEVGLLHHRGERTVTAALCCSGGNFILADTSVQTQRLVDWANLLNILGTEYTGQGLVRWSLMARAVPDLGNRAQRYLINRAVDTTTPAYRSLAQLTAAAAPTAQRHEVYLVTVWDTARMSGEIADAGGSDQAIAAVVVDRLGGVAAAVAEAGVTTHGWLTTRGYAAVLRTQFDPDDQAVIDLRATTDTLAAGVTPRMAGPAAAETVGWSCYRHDSGISQTLWVYEMPRRPVGLTWLTPLFTRTSSRRTVTLTAQPVPEALAQLAARREKVATAGDEITKRRLRLVRTAREDEEARAVEQIDREQAAGHVRHRYCLLVTVTSTSAEQLGGEVRAVKRILSRTGCAAVVLAGEQDQAFAAGALPLGRGLKPMRGWLA
ncbi:MAG TPA: SCO6880 family protein [Rugosimonospora sp.]|nr:SCO6880 family protein [Rugosimonospora sp.]